MTFTPDPPALKSRGDLIRSKDWNDAIGELQRLDTAKVNKLGDAITGTLTVSGSVGIGMTAPSARLTVQTPNSYDGDTLRVETKLEPDRYSLKLNTTVTAGNVRWVFNQVNAGTSSANVLAFNQGNIGIGTSEPQAKLQVSGGAFMPAAGNNEQSGILFPPDPGGGSGDRAWVRYYSRGGEAMTLEIGVANDADDHIALMPNAGNVGIGTNNPGTKLEVIGTTKTSKLRLADKWLLSGDGDAGINDDWLRLFKADGTNAYYGGFAANKLWSNGGTVQGSDLRMKTHVESLDHPLEDLLTLRGVRFRWQSEGDTGKEHLGLVAQEVDLIFPELVEIGPDGMKGINYDGLIAPLIEAIKQQQLQIAELRSEIQALQAG